MLNLQQHTWRRYHRAHSTQITDDITWVAENSSIFNIYFFLPPPPIYNSRSIPNFEMRDSTVPIQFSWFFLFFFLNIKIISNGTNSEAVQALPYFKYEQKTKTV